jgi:hypothetical protein
MTNVGYSIEIAMVLRPEYHVRRCNFKLVEAFGLKYPMQAEMAILM